MKTLYLAHNFYRRKLIRKWELKIEGKYNINLDNPFYDNLQRAIEMRVIDKMKDHSSVQRAYHASRNEISITEDDLEKIRKSDGVMAFVNEIRIGTPMEIFYAHRILRIPVYTVTHKYAHHPWIKRHSDKIFSNRKDLERFLGEKFGLKE